MSQYRKYKLSYCAVHIMAPYINYASIKLEKKTDEIVENGDFIVLSKEKYICMYKLQIQIGQFSDSTNKLSVFKLGF